MFMLPRDRFLHLLMLVNMLTFKYIADVLRSTKRGVAIAEMAGAGTPTGLRGATKQCPLTTLRLIRASSKN